MWIVQQGEQEESGAGKEEEGNEIDKELLRVK